MAWHLIRPLFLCVPDTFYCFLCHTFPETRPYPQPWNQNPHQQLHLPQLAWTAPSEVSYFRQTHL